jgi:hypothetical protein
LFAIRRITKLEPASVFRNWVALYGYKANKATLSMPSSDAI